MDQFGKIRRHHWKELLKISKIAKFESDTSLASENIERFHSRDQRLCKFMGTEESVYIRKEINSYRIDLEHQYGRRDVTW